MPLPGPQSTAHPPPTSSRSAACPPLLRSRSATPRPRLSTRAIHTPPPLPGSRSKSCRSPRARDPLPIQRSHARSPRPIRHFCARDSRHSNCAGLTIRSVVLLPGSRSIASCHLRSHDTQPSATRGLAIHRPPAAPMLMIHKLLRCLAPRSTAKGRFRCRERKWKM